MMEMDCQSEQSHTYMVMKTEHPPAHTVYKKGKLPPKERESQKQKEKRENPAFSGGGTMTCFRMMGVF